MPNFARMISHFYRSALRNVLWIGLAFSVGLPLKAQSSETAGMPAPDEKMQISPAFLAPFAHSAAHAGVTASATRKNFHGVSSAGGSERKRIRSLVTGWVKASEYAHSASLPLTAYSPP